MLFTKVFVVLSAAVSAVSAAVIPAGTPDGAYAMVTIDGKEIHLTMENYLKQYPQGPPEQKDDETSLELPGTSPSSVGSNLMKRQDMFCGCGWNMVDWETNNAVQALKDECGDGSNRVPAWGAFYHISGPVVAFICSRSNWSANNLAWNSGDIAWGYADITNNCGLYIAGTRRYQNYNPFRAYPDGSIYLGYMRYNGNGHDFCAESTNSGSTHC